MNATQTMHETISQHRRTPLRIAAVSHQGTGLLIKGQDVMACSIDDASALRDLADRLEQMQHSQYATPAPPVPAPHGWCDPVWGLKEKD
jgi:hypothetical protein